MDKQSRPYIKLSLFKQHVVFNHYSLYISHICCDLVKIKPKRKETCLLGSVYNAFHLFLETRVWPESVASGSATENTLSTLAEPLGMLNTLRATLVRLAGCIIAVVAPGVVVVVFCR